MVNTHTFQAGYQTVRRKFNTKQLNELNKHGELNDVLPTYTTNVKIVSDPNSIVRAVITVLADEALLAKLAPDLLVPSGSYKKLDYETEKSV